VPSFQGLFSSRATWSAQQAQASVGQRGAQEVAAEILEVLAIVGAHQCGGLEIEAIHSRDGSPAQRGSLSPWPRTHSPHARRSAPALPRSARWSPPQHGRVALLGRALLARFESERHPGQAGHDRGERLEHERLERLIALDRQRAERGELEDVAVGAGRTHVCPCATRAARLEELVGRRARHPFGRPRRQTPRRRRAPRSRPDLGSPPFEASEQHLQHGLEHRLELGTAAQRHRQLELELEALVRPRAHRDPPTMLGLEASSRLEMPALDGPVRSASAPRRCGEIAASCAKGATCRERELARRVKRSGGLVLTRSRGG
jgi:hypothetical protein